MGEAGILREDERVELIEGEILEMAAAGSRHAAGVKRLNRLFSRLGDRAVVSVQDPLQLSETSVPEPDLVLLRPRPDFYASGHPTPGDVFLVVEVSDTSLAYDRDVKLPLYAEAGVPEVWLVDLVERTVWVCRNPGGRRYQDVRPVGRDERLAPLAFPDLTLPVAEVVR